MLHYPIHLEFQLDFVNFPLYFLLNFQTHS